MRSQQHAIVTSPESGNASRNLDLACAPQAPNTGRFPKNNQRSGKGIETLISFASIATAPDRSPLYLIDRYIEHAASKGDAGAAGSQGLRLMQGTQDPVHGGRAMFRLREVRHRVYFPDQPGPTGTEGPPSSDDPEDPGECRQHLSISEGEANHSRGSRSGQST